MFSNIYNYVSSKGVVIPDTTVVLSDIEQSFKDAFNDQSLDTTQETAVGRLIEAIAKLFVDVIGANAQNLNNLNPYHAEDKYLDMVGNLFGVSRNGDDDNVYRQRILASVSLGSGYPQSITNALSKLGCNRICVLENGESYPCVKPNQDAGIAVPAHSVYVGLNMNGVSDTNIANAIFAAKSAGCGFDTATHGDSTKHTVTVKDDDTSATNDVTFYQIESKSMTIDVSVSNHSYSGSSLQDDIIAAISDYMNDVAPGTRVYAYNLANAIFSSVSGISLKSVTFDGADHIDILPYQMFDSDETTVNITIS